MPATHRATLKKTDSKGQDAWSPPSGTHRATLASSDSKGVDATNGGYGSALEAFLASLGARGGTSAPATISGPAAYSGGYSPGTYNPSQDYLSIATQRVKTAADAQHLANQQARAAALREWTLAMASLGKQAGTQVATTRANNQEMDDRLNNVMAARGIGRGESAGVNFANQDAKASQAMAAIASAYQDRYGQMAEQNQVRQQTLTDAEKAIDAATPAKIEELRAALESQDFSRWNATQSLNLQAANQQTQIAAMNNSAALAYAQMNNANQNNATLMANNNQNNALNMGFQGAMAQDARTAAQQTADTLWGRQTDYASLQRFNDIAAKVFEAGQANKDWVYIKNLVHSLGGNDPALNNVDAYKSMLSGTRGYAGAFPSINASGFRNMGSPPSYLEQFGSWIEHPFGWW